ncbi:MULTISPECIES: hypothetical protein [Legionella]|uniref:Xylose isomerase-like TIM barrel n=1 Tax=Legionella resiliens TaxID=2905958 RepID=A0ABS8X3Z0_9GAMM|nr:MULTISPECIES: hypothetical protein [unclassified Legionella]MCE0723515.1 hypothetical protein [Legionella sp. 9fVS26]MCE3532669.1 hypothetical protein [Legionella sp. 8cVS16]QLZ68803.1 hypothetical protein FOLKNPGA_01583 [Legionella sp. PC1000]
MSICILKGSKSESIDEINYPSIKGCYQELIKALVKKGFPLESIKIYFDDEKRQIHFDYYPDELDVLITYTDFDEKLQLNVTQLPFASNWDGNRYLLWHNKSVEEYVAEIKSLHKLSVDLAQQTNYPHPRWNFSQASHSYLSVPQRKEALKKSFSELKNKNAFPQGIYLGEIHHHKFPKKFLTENLEYFKQLGIKTLFFEFLFYDRHQTLLDAYLNSPSEELPPELAAYLHFKDVASGCGFSGYTDVVKAAKKAGIRVVALDSYPAILSCIKGFQIKYLGGDEYFRIHSFNGNAAKIIEKESNGEPYLAFLGFDHSYISGNSRYKNIKSVAELLPNTCSVFLTDSQVSYKNLYAPFFSHGKPLVFNYSRYHEAGANIIETSWNTLDCRL